MQDKILSVFYAEDRLPYKDASRETHYPIVNGNVFNGSNNVTKIRYYLDRIGGFTNVTWVVVSKLPNGQLASEVLNSNNAIYDEELGEHYVEFEISSYYTTLKGDVYLSLQGYQGGVEMEQDEDTGIYSIYGTPTIQATGSIKIGVNYAPQIVQGTHFTTSDLQQVLGLISDKANISDVLIVNKNIGYKTLLELSQANDDNWFIGEYDDKLYLIKIVYIEGDTPTCDYAIYEFSEDSTIKSWVGNDDAEEYFNYFIENVTPNEFALKSYVDTQDEIIKTYVENNFVMKIPYSQASGLTTLFSLVNLMTPGLLTDECKAIVELRNDVFYLCGFYKSGSNTVLEIELIGNKDRWQGSFSLTALTNTQLSTFLSTSSSNTYYQPYATQNYVDTAIKDFLQNEYTKVNTTTYPTLDDFLASTGDEGYIYLYPIDPSDETKGYYQYIWENDEWVSLGTTQIDLSDYVQKTELLASDQDIQDIMEA